eukprot:scaffold5814_cov123-Isochrysis_galbana.AAC.4
MPTGAGGGVGAEGGEGKGGEQSPSAGRQGEERASMLSPIEGEERRVSMHWPIVAQRLRLPPPTRSMPPTTPDAQRRCPSGKGAKPFQPYHGAKPLEAPSP